MKGLDCSVPVDPHAAVAAGYGFVCRYLSGNSPLTATEAEGYTEAGLGIVSLWETNPNAALGGENQGIGDALAAVRQARVIGQVPGSAIYAATDFDPASAIPAVVAYYRGFASVRAGHYLCGAYLGAKAANAALGAGVIDRTMIPGASSWADGAVPLRTDIQQSASTDTIAGTTVDLDAAAADFGAWNHHGLFPTTPTPPPEVHMDTVWLIEAEGEANHLTVHVPDKSWWLVTDQLKVHQVATPGGIAAYQAIIPATRRAKLPGAEIVALARG